MATSESKWTKTGVIATAFGSVFGLIAAGAAVAVFFIRSADGGDPSDQSSTSSAETQQNPTDAPNPSRTGAAANERHLAELPLAQGGGAVTVIDGRDLSVPCGSGQSDDLYRQIEYELPGPYASFATRATVSGKADVEASVGVQVFVRARQERSDRTLEAGRVVLQGNGSEPVTADIAQARAILLRITCSVPTLNVTFTDPRIAR